MPRRLPHVMSAPVQLVASINSAGVAPVPMMLAMRMSSRRPQMSIT
ncbi:hypothetical protein [Azospirillum argentinense]|nr:hypothetical protein [Azospirillum argentinense]